MTKKSCDCDLCTRHGCRCAEYAAFFMTLGNNTRIHILNALRTGAKNVTQLCELTSIEQTTLSHNLRKLQEGGLVTSERDGKFIIYALTPHTDDLLRFIDAHMERHEIVEVPA